MIKENKRINLLHSQLKNKKLTWVMKAITPLDLPQKTQNLKGKTLFITGASRGIGLAIALKAAKQGANIAVVAKTVTPQKTLSGTIYTAVEEINKAGGVGLAIQCDIRFEESVKEAVSKTIERFGGIDILINNASAIALTSTSDTSMKSYDLIHSINTRGTFLCTKYCLPYLKLSKNPHILTLSPPLNIEEKWIKNYVAYSLSKFGMSILTSAFSSEFKEFGIAANTLWPRTSIATAAVQNYLGGESMMKKSRKPEMMADAALIVFNSDSKIVTGNHFIDDEILVSSGIKDLSIYNCDPNVKNEDLYPDLFC